MEASLPKLTSCQVAYLALVKWKLIFFSLCKVFITVIKEYFASGHWLLQGVPRRAAEKLLKSELSPLVSHEVTAARLAKGNIFFPFSSMIWLYLNLPKFPPQLLLPLKFTCFLQTYFFTLVPHCIKGLVGSKSDVPRGLQTFPTPEMM